jgi:inosine/xanthosine triphosphatase
MSKRVVVGSQNPVKVNAIQVIFKTYEVTAKDVPSGVSLQPFSDEETMQGAITRAFYAKRYGEIGIGLEGGVCETPFGLQVINYGALVDESKRVYLAGGTRVPLPLEVSTKLKQGIELGDVMDQYSHKMGVRHDEGAVGIFTNNLVKRQEIFEHIAKLLLGQYIIGKTAISYTIDHS